MKASFMMAELKVMVPVHGRMEKHIPGSGRIVRKTGMEHIPLTMGTNTMDIGKMARSTEEVFINLPMEICLMKNGNMIDGL